MGYAQTTNQFIKKDKRTTIQFEVLPDKGYTIQQVSSDTGLRFKSIDTLHFVSSVNYYWIKFKLYNPSHFDEKYILYVNPAIENTSFQFDSVQQKWLSQKFGYDVAGRYLHLYPSSVITIRRNETQVNYVLCGINKYKKYVKSYKPELLIISEQVQADKETLPFYAWVISLVTLLLFFLYNTYLYVVLKDKTYLYFLLLQIGAAIYVTAATHLFHNLTETPFFSLFKMLKGDVNLFNKDNLFNRVGAIIVIGSFVQLTRHYLATQLKAPLIDKRLKLLWWLYLLVEMAFLVGFLTHATLPSIHAIIENFFSLIVVIYIYYATWYSYKRNYKPAFYLLVANLIPLSIIVILIICLTITKVFTGFVQIVPNIAIISQAITFAIALHLRLKNLKYSLNEQQEEAITLKQQIETLVQRQESIARENEIIGEQIKQEKYKNEELLQKLEANQRELASNTMFMYQKNSLLSYLKGQMKELNKMLPDSATQASKNIDASLQNHQFLEADWDKFKLHFENVHPSFFEDLKKKYPDLTKNETRLCAYLHLNMSTKEIAALLNIDPGSVRRAKTRLNKKMNLQPSDLD